jgi:sigma-B regulation protein RsbU (phosphoserine phosphatase)
MKANPPVPNDFMMTIPPPAELSRPELEQRVAELTERNAVLEKQLAAKESNHGMLDSKFLLQALLDGIPDRIYFKDTSSRFVKCSRAVAKRLGTEDPEKVVGKTDFDFLPPARAAVYFENEQRIMKTGEPLINEPQKQTKANGEVVWMSATKVPLRDQAGKIVGLAGINRDITEQKQETEALRQSRDELERLVAERTAKLSQERCLLRTLIDNLPDCIYAKDMAGRKTLANPADLRNLRCRTEAEALGKNDFDFFPPAQAEKFWADDQKVLHGEPVINREEFFFDEHGHKRWLLSSKLPLHNEDGAIVGLIGIARDITIIKEAEEKLSAHMQELEQRDHQTQEELNMARELQLAMLPQAFPSIPSCKPASESQLEFFSFYRPSGAVSGDFFDVVPLSDNVVGLFICDAMGHDVRAALVTAMMRALVADLSVTLKDPGELLAQMNRELAGIFKQSGSIMYATAFYLIVDLAREEFRFASAAHPDPIFLHRSSNTAEWLKVDAGAKKGPALGLFADSKYATFRRPMAAGDVIAMFTDGLIEVEGANNEIYSADHLLASIQNRAQLPSHDLFTGVIEEIKRFAVQPKFDDDICLASVEVKRLDRI